MSDSISGLYEGGCRFGAHHNFIRYKSMTRIKIPCIDLDLIYINFQVFMREKKKDSIRKDIDYEMISHL